MNVRLQSSKFVLLASIALATLPRPTFAADVLQHIPQDALGFIFIKNLADTDAKADQLLKTLAAPYPSPIVFLKAVTGIDEGLNPEGSFLLAAIPGNDDQNPTPKFAVWLPVADYNALLKSLEATPGDEISAIRLADEDLLIAHQSDWALIMDPDERERLKSMLAGQPNPPAIISAWKNLFEANELAVVLTPPGITAAIQWAAKGPATPAIPVDAEGPMRATTYESIHAEIQKWLRQSPEFHDLLKHSSAVGIAARLDKQGNSLTSARIRTAGALQIKDWGPELLSPPSLIPPTDFVLHGAGHTPPALVKVAAATYARSIFQELKDAEQMDVDAKSVEKFVETFIIAADAIKSWSVAKPIGNTADGAYTNNLLAIRVTSVKDFVDHAGHVMDEWNEIHRNAKQGMRLIFDIEEKKIGKRPATQFSIDVAAVEGMPALPALRPMMEKFFGPGGRLRLWIVPVDQQTVLLASATKDQVASALELLDRNQPIDWNQPSVVDTNKLLPEDSDVRLFLSPHGRSQWHSRFTEAMNGVAIGGPTTKNFPESPPIGIAGRIRDNELWLDAVVPAKTIEAAGTVLQKKKQ